MTQIDLIGEYWAFADAAQTCEGSMLAAHYTHILFAIKKLIESFGPTPEYIEWEKICKGEQ